MSRMIGKWSLLLRNVRNERNEWETIIREEIRRKKCGKATGLDGIVVVSHHGGKGDHGVMVRKSL